VGNDSFWGQQVDDTGIIWEFNGKKFLEERDTILQVRMNSTLPVMDPKLYYGFNVPKEYRNPPEYNTSARGSGGLWLPPETAPPSPFYFVNLVPRYYPLSRVESPDSTNSVPPLYIYEFSKDDPGYDSVSRFDFFFRFTGTSDLFAARLDINPGADIPPDWYRRVRPFSYDIHDVTLQRGGATILNNVIDPTKGEKAYLRSHLVRGGRVTVQVFTLDGNLVRVLYRGHRAAGEYIDPWDGKNNGGRAVARGMYFIRVVAPDIDEIRKVMVVK
jgi:hypothetical protein